jgi:hypothetical protein
MDDGTPSRKLCKSALNYLHKSKRIIDDPFGRGAYWTDVLMNRAVAEWAVSTVVDGIDWLYRVTHDGALGNFTLRTHSRQTKINWQNKSSDPT